MKAGKTLRILGAVAAVFGLMTIVSGGQALFLAPGQGPDMGQVVLPVLWFNFFAGFAYLATGIGLWLHRRWAVVLAAALALATLLMFAYLGVHIAGGGDFETRTVIAMTLRSAFWVTVAWISARVSRSVFAGRFPAH